MKSFYVRVKLIYHVCPNLCSVRGDLCYVSLVFSSKVRVKSLSSRESQNTGVQCHLISTEI